MRKIEQCKTGDMICDQGGNKAKVLLRAGSIIFRSEWYRFDIAAQHFISIHEARNLGWKILTKEGLEPMSKKEVERLLNVKITK